MDRSVFVREHDTVPYATPCVLFNRLHFARVATSWTTKRVVALIVCWLLWVELGSSSA